MPNGVSRLFDSSTFVLSVLSMAAHAANPILFPLDTVLTVLGIYGGKEGLGKIGAGLAARKAQPEPESKPG